MRGLNSCAALLQLEELSLSKQAWHVARSLCEIVDDFDGVMIEWEEYVTLVEMWMQQISCRAAI